MSERKPKKVIRKRHERPGIRVYQIASQMDSTAVGVWFALAATVAAIWMAVSCAPLMRLFSDAETLEPPPVSRKDPDRIALDPERPCLSKGQGRQLTRILFLEMPGSGSPRWAEALNDSFHHLGADCEDPAWLMLVVSVIQMESGVRVDPPLAATDLEALFVQQMGQLAEDNLLAAGVISLSDFDDEVREKLRQDTARGHIRTEGQLARYVERDLRPWVRAELGRRYLVPEALAREIEQRWLSDPVQTIGPMQVSVAKAYRNAQARGETIGSEAVMRELLLQPDTALERGLLEGIALLWPVYRYYKGRMPAQDAAYFAAVDYNSGEFSCRNAAYQEMLAALTGRPLSLDGDLLIYSGGTAVAASSRSEIAALEALAGMTDQEVRADLLLEKSAAFDRTAAARGICAAYQVSLSRPCPAARVPAGASNPRAGLKLGRAYSPANYARAISSRLKRNHSRYTL